MEYAQDYLEIKKQLFELIEISNKSIKTKTLKINQELASLQKGNNLILFESTMLYLIIYIKLVKELIEKIDGLSFRTNVTLVTEVSSQLRNNNTINPKHKRNRSNKAGESKINIQNLVINKKVQIGKNFSKLNISNISTSPNKSINYQIDQNYHPLMRNISNFHPKKNASIIKMRIYSKNKTNTNLTDTNMPEKNNSNNKSTIRDNQSHGTFNQEDLDKSNGTISQILNKTSDQKLKKNPTGLKTSETNNDVRKLSIMDIPSIDMKDISLKNKNKKTMRNYLYSKNQKFYYVLAKENILPLQLRLTFAKKISNFYTKEEVYSDYYNYIMTNYNALSSIKDEYLPFMPSLTSQVALNFITSVDEKNCVNIIRSGSNSNKNVNDNDGSNSNNNSDRIVTQNQLVAFYNLLIVFYYLVNEPIDDSLPKDAVSLYNDLLTRVLTKGNSVSLKSYQFEAIHKKTLTISLHQLCHIQEIYDKIVNHYNFKPFDKVSSAMLFLLKDIYDYSRLKMSNEDLMIKFNYNLTRFEKLKADLEQNDS